MSPKKKVKRITTDAASTNAEEQSQVTTVTKATKDAKPAAGKSSKGERKFKARKVTEKEKAFIPFRFGDLPHDIRLMIYDIHLVHKRGLVRLYHRANPFVGRVKPANLGINILLTCRQIYYEAIEVLYSRNTFCVLPPLAMKDGELGGGCCEFSTALLGYLEGDHGHPLNALRNMGEENRARIRKVEIPLLMPQLCCYEHFLPVSSLLPNLRSQILFVDIQANFIWPNRDPEEIIEACRAWLKTMATKGTTTFDLSFLEDYDRWFNPEKEILAKEMISSFEDVFKDAFPNGLPRSKSIFSQTMQEDQCDWDFQQFQVEEWLEESVGLHISHSSEEDYFDYIMAVDANITDDESVAEVEKEKWDVQSSAHRKWQELDPEGYWDYVNDLHSMDGYESGGDEVCSNCGEVHGL